MTEPETAAWHPLPMVPLPATPDLDDSRVRTNPDGSVTICGSWFLNPDCPCGICSGRDYSMPLACWDVVGRGDDCGHERCRKVYAALVEEQQRCKLKMGAP